MRKTLLLITLVGFVLIQLNAQVSVSVNFDIEHSVGGVSDFGRERHITVHSSLGENDWNGEAEKMNYLMNELDVYFGRDNGASAWFFHNTPAETDASKMPDYFTTDMQGISTFGVHDVDAMTTLGQAQKQAYDSKSPTLLQYESRSGEMICGTQPHPLYPTLGWHDGCYASYVSPKWRPLLIETSAGWVTEYLDKYFAKSESESGEPLPKYWEVINEPDMQYMTGSYMETSLEELFRYHNLVADSVRARLGDKAPLIGGMTWGLHDLSWADGVSRYYPVSEAPADYHQTLKDVRSNATATAFESGRGSDWYQWDAIWKGFMDTSGDKMDFYSIHIYDWINWDTYDYGVQRTGGQTEAILDMVDWYQNFKYNESKEIIISEYGAIVDQEKYPQLDPKFVDWANLRTFSHQFMQFLERPDIIKKSMPFAPIKAEWGDWYDENGNLTNRYPITMMDKDAQGNWQWREIIKWYELWSEVDGKRIDTKATDRDIQVDAYVDGKIVYLIINSLELTASTVGISYFGNEGNTLETVEMKRLYLDETLGNDGQPVLTNTIFSEAPSEVRMYPEETMIIKYVFENDVVVDETSVEEKYYSDALNSGTAPYRVKSDAITTSIDGVTIPTNGEATLRICGVWHENYAMTQHSQNIITVNNNEIIPDMDWRGNLSGQNWFGVMEIDVPMEYLKADNEIYINIAGEGTYSCISLQVWDFSTAPGRETDLPIAAIAIPDTEISADGFARNSGGMVKDGKIEQYKTGNWLEYDVNALIAGDYDLKFYYTSGIDNNQIKVYVDDNTTPVLTVAIPTTSGWSNFAWSLTNTVNFTKGLHTLRFECVGDILLDDFYLHIDGDIQVDSVKLNASAITIEPGEVTQMLATVYPDAATDNTVSWSSDNTSVFTVVNGVVTGADEGTATLTVTTNSGAKTATCEVTVAKTPVSEVVLTPATLALAVGNTSQLSAEVLPSDASMKTVSWSSGNSGIVSVNTSGLVTGVAEGTAKVYAISDDGGLKDSCEVTVSFIDVVSVSVTPETSGLKVSETLSLKAEISPADASNKNVSWSSDNTGVATVSATGVVNAISIGTANITVTTVDGTKTDIAIVSVVSADGAIIIQAEDFTSTGGTYNDESAGGSGLGFNLAGTTINYGNNGDWAEYELVIPEDGIYQITYTIACPSDNATITGGITETAFTVTDNVPNNGLGGAGWDSYTSQIASGTPSLTAGTYTFRITAGGAEWAWNMDKIEFIKIGTVNAEEYSSNTVKLYPVPAEDVLYITGINITNCNVQVFNVQGTLLLNEQLATNSIDVSNLPEGYYFLNIAEENKLPVTVKFTK